MLNQNRKKMIAAYVSDWGWIGISKESAACLTHVNYSFALVRDGYVSDAHWTHAKELDEGFDDVLKHADSAMYLHKRALKRSQLQAEQDNSQQAQTNHK